MLWIWYLFSYSRVALMNVELLLAQGCFMHVLFPKCGHSSA